MVYFWVMSSQEMSLTGDDLHMVMKKKSVRNLHKAFKFIEGNNGIAFTI